MRTAVIKIEMSHTGHKVTLPQRHVRWRETMGKGSSAEARQCKHKCPVGSKQEMTHRRKELLQKMRHKNEGNISKCQSYEHTNKD